MYNSRVRITVMGENMNLAVKIAFFDVDGTLLPIGEKEPSNKTVYALKELQKNGVILCMATGRGVLMMPKLRDICFDAYITFNGSYCFTDSEVISKTPIPPADVLQIWKNTQQMKRAMAISNEKYTVANGTDADLETYFSFGGSSLVIDENFADKCKEDIYQIMMSCRSSEYETILKGTQGTAVTAWWDKAADFIPLESGKGQAVKRVLDYYGFSPQEAIAFGDGSNDIAMFNAVETAVAMGNASDTVKEVADDICQSVDEDGIYFYCVDNNIIQRM